VCYDRLRNKQLQKRAGHAHEAEEQLGTSEDGNETTYEGGDTVGACTRHEPRSYSPCSENNIKSIWILGRIGVVNSPLGRYDERILLPDELALRN